MLIDSQQEVCGSCNSLLFPVVLVLPVCHHCLGHLGLHGHLSDPKNAQITTTMLSCDVINPNLFNHLTFFPGSPILPGSPASPGSPLGPGGPCNYLIVLCHDESALSLKFKGYLTSTPGFPVRPGIPLSPFVPGSPYHHINNSSFMNVKSKLYCKGTFLCTCQI